MLAIRMQRTGRKGHAMFRVVVQDSRVTPTSGKVVAQLGSYNPHTKAAVLDKEKAATFLKNGAQPSDRAALLLKSEGVKLPKWVSVDTKKSGQLRNADKLRKNRPAEPKAEEAPLEEAPAEEPAADSPSEAPAKDEAPAPEEATSETETPEKP
jgi:small subunit ribosomal protein S16